MTSSEYVLNCTLEQKIALLKIWSRNKSESWKEFIEEAMAPSGSVVPYCGVVWCGMFLGIEEDGYTHS